MTGVPSAPELEPDHTARLWELWQALLARLLERLQSGAEATAAELNCARAFLRDNRVSAASRPSIRDGLRELAKLTTLPFDPPEET
jgi:hypothetical protein